MSEERSARKVYQGHAVSDKMDETITVTIDTYKSAPIYGKRVKYSRRYYAHDESNEAKTGDIVQIMETRPLSAKKCLRLVRIVRKAATL